MRVAALYDVHGNLPALDAVLAEVNRSEIDLIVFGGDVAWGPLPRETVTRVMELGERAATIRGNADREVAARCGAEDGLEAWVAVHNQWCSDQLSPQQLEWLGGLPPSLVIDIEGLGEVLFCHGSPRSDEESITTATPADRLRDMLSGIEQNTIVCGHTHAQFKRSIGAATVINAGSVGLPFGEAGAYWCTLGPRIELRRTAYDLDSAATRFRSEGGPEGAGFAAHVLAPPPHETAAQVFT